VEKQQVKLGLTRSKEPVPNMLFESLKEAGHVFSILKYIGDILPIRDEAEKLLVTTLH